MSEYNGWRNYETWNVVLWIDNDEGLNHLLKGVRCRRDPYTALLETFKELNIVRTLDRVRYDDPCIDRDEINDYIRGML